MSVTIYEKSKAAWSGVLVEKSMKISFQHPDFMCIERTDRSYHGENKIKKNDRSNPAGKQYSGIKGI